ncbi:hypothetical protein PGTUg99_007450 [Puccinia graminis f. sp. tritici]|uniref:Uncharacterized protein n=1 Tax=Puccinia graminis f. sp. tritici TaxID=56615 RepID=A0A5B0PW14_PUCGR|nr:hypothetical protein PGTUg99_007450 [Puccinia graminis f. sp. tritici]
MKAQYSKLSRLDQYSTKPNIDHRLGRPEIREHSQSPGVFQPFPADRMESENTVRMVIDRHQSCFPTSSKKTPDTRTSFGIGEASRLREIESTSIWRSNKHHHSEVRRATMMGSDHLHQAHRKALTIESFRSYYISTPQQSQAVRGLRTPRHFLRTPEGASGSGRGRNANLLVFSDNFGLGMDHCEVLLAPLQHINPARLGMTVIPDFLPTALILSCPNPSLPRDATPAEVDKKNGHQALVRVNIARMTLSTPLTAS